VAPYGAADLAAGSRITQRIAMRPAIALAAALLASPALATPPSPPGSAQPAPLAARPDGAHDFDFEFGAWKMHLRRRLRPLTGSTDWVEYAGVSVVRKVWNGAANLGEIEIDGPAGHIEGLSLRVYDPQARQWSLNFANRAAGTTGPPMIGGFKDGRGEFYDQEMLGDRPIFVRFIFSDIALNSFKIEQAFSGDGGKTWETNWISTFTRGA
jgi:hypothetical protein